jgi:hypothetical protein
MAWVSYNIYPFDVYSAKGASESGTGMTTKTKESVGVPEKMSCGGHFRQHRYEDRRDKASYKRK